MRKSPRYTMNVISSRKNMLYAVVIIFFILVGILFYATNEKNDKQNGIIHKGNSIMQSPIPSEIPVQIIPKGNQVNVQEDKGNNTFVRYEKGLFIPREITIKNETGCFFEIQNTGNTDIIPRLGPYDPQKEKGFLYPAVSPHTKSLIDPRYGTDTSESFYDKNNPTADFIVHIDPTCF